MEIGANKTHLLTLTSRLKEIDKNSFSKMKAEDLKTSQNFGKKDAPPVSNLDDKALKTDYEMAKKMMKPDEKPKLNLAG